MPFAVAGRPLPFLTDRRLPTGHEFIFPAFGSLTSSFCGARYVLGDFNGDGRTDAACADNGKVALSTGSAFVVQGTTPSRPPIPTGATSRTQFDTAQHLFPVQVTNAVGETSTSAWDAGCAVPVQASDANGQVSTRTLDAFCRVTRQDGPLGSFEVRRYLDLGSISEQRLVTEGPGASGSASPYVSEYLDGFGRTYRTVRSGRAPGRKSSLTRRSPPVVRSHRRPARTTRANLRPRPRATSMTRSTA